MSNTAGTINNQSYNLTPVGSKDSWSQFTRGLGSATSIISSIPVGKYLEVFDKKFNGDSLIIFRRRDFDNLNMLSSMSTKISRCLMQISTMTTTYEDAKDPRKIINLIREEARMGIEFTVVPSTISSSDYYSTYVFENENEDKDENIVLPSSRKDIEG